MKINLEYIYISFTSFTASILNILLRCKYCKYDRTISNEIKYSLLHSKMVLFYIYTPILTKTLVFIHLQKFIYSIYNIYSFIYAPKSQQKNSYEK
jgi:hypothetical protein